ncbi:Glycosyltransferase involved in cell wall bisynthesis [Bacillus sp. OK048]|nr:Glycosyltransferase involved in cell wall bisynthesis [Bacillus sp. OK048]
MKILLATYWALPQLGGVWTLMCEIKERLESYGHEVDILGNCQDSSGYQIINKNLVIKKEQLIPVLSTPINRQSSLVANVNKVGFDFELDLYCMELAVSYFGLEQYDIIHTHDVISSRCMSRVKPKQTPLFTSIHGVLAREIIRFNKFHNPNVSIEEILKSTGWLQAWVLDKLGSHSADLIHFSSTWTKDIFIEDYGLSNDRIVTFQYGMNIDEFSNKMNHPTEIKKPQDKKVIIYTGRLVDLKGVQILLPALSQLKKEREDWVCWIAGDGVMKLPLQKLSAQLNLNEFVEFLGARDDIPALLKQSDIFVLPSLQDNMPLSLIEAQIAGKASVISDAGGLPDMVKHGETGLIAPAGESEPLFEHLKTLLENDSYRNKLADNAKQWAFKHWSIDLMTERLLKIYKNMIENDDNTIGQLDL